MEQYAYITLRQKPELKEEAAAWFHDKWGVPQTVKEVLTGCPVKAVMTIMLMHIRSL